MNADRYVTIAAAVASPVLGLLVDINVISATVSLDLGGIIATAVTAYHGGKAVQKRAQASKAPSP